MAILRRVALAVLLATMALGCDEPPDNFVVAPPFGQVEGVYATSLDGWADNLANAIDTIDNDDIEPVPLRDVNTESSMGMSYAWARDAWVFGWTDGKPAALLTPGGHPLHDWADREFASEGILVIDVAGFRGWPQSRFDAGGNIMATPPLPPRWPLGRIVVGRDIQPELKSYFKRLPQAGSRRQLVELDTSWLRVGHVDELIAFVPGPDGGFKLVLPDPIAGQQLLRTVPAGRAVFYTAGARERAGAVTEADVTTLTDADFDFGDDDWQYVRIYAGAGAGQVARIERAEGNRLVIECVWDMRDLKERSAAAGMWHGLMAEVESQNGWYEQPDATSRYLAVTGSQLLLDEADNDVPAVLAAGELATDPALQRMCARLGARIDGRGGIREQMTRALGGLRDDQIVRVPVLPMDDGAGREVWWLMPHPVNLLNLKRTIATLQPFGPRSDPSDDASDVWMTGIAEALSASSSPVVFLDGWNALHRGGGGAHCGTNLLLKIRKPADTVAPPLDPLPRAAH